MDCSFGRPWRVRSPGKIGAVTVALAELARHCRLVVAMESSGTYGDPFRQALADAGVEVRRVSAKAVKDYSETFDARAEPARRQGRGGHRHAVSVRARSRPPLGRDRCRLT